MTRKTRRFIFYIFVILFIIIALSIILYAQGYSFDWQKKSLAITGAFYFRSYPKEADIFINNLYQGGTNKFIKRLLPQKYDIKISKPEYYDWQKTLIVKSKLVTEAQNILLIKKNPALNLVAYNKIKKLFFSTDNNKIIYLTNSSQPALRLLNLTNDNDIQIYPAPLSEEIEYIPSLPNLNNLLNIFWSPGDEKIILSFPNNHYYILNLKNPPGIIDVDNLIKTLSNYEIRSIENPLFHPQNSDKIYFYFKNNLYFIEINNTNLQKSLISPPVIQDILAYTIYGNKILYINTEGKFYKTNLETSSFKNIFDIPLLKPEQSIGIVNDEILVINNSLYFLNPENQIFEKITDNIEETAFSDDENKIVWQTKDKIGIIWMKEDFGQPQRKKYETEIIIKTTKEISQAVWYSKTNQHIIFVIGDDIKITELDGRQERNTNNIFSIKNPEIFYNKDNEKLYILSNEQLFEINMKN